MPPTRAAPLGNGPDETHIDWVDLQVTRDADRPCKIASREALATGTSSRASVSDTSVWQLAFLPSAEAYCEATPTERLSFFGTGHIVRRSCAGWLAGQIVRGAAFGLTGDLIISIIGAFIGDWLLPQVGIHLGTGIVSAIINAAVGAVLLLLVIRILRGGWGGGWSRRRWW